MIKKSLIVPKGIKFISQWKDYKLSNFNFPHILDKKIPGCGYTEYCLTNDMNIILCSPRKMLLSNKTKQHFNDVFYFKSDLDNDPRIDKDLTKVGGKSAPYQSMQDDIEKNKRQQVLETIKDLLKQLSQYINFRTSHHLPCKILVTYDSFRLVKDYLIRNNMFQYFYTVVDEMQAIFCDSRFKSDTELEFMNYLHDVQNLCFVSATPMIDEYLEKLDEFRNLPYFELDWESEDPLRVIKPDLKVRTTKSVTSTALEIIKDFKEGKFETFPYRDNIGNLCEIISNEAVFYINSVNNITSIISRAGLIPEECNILCARTDYNENRIKKRLGKDFVIGEVPIRGEQHKMFTFCTRTVYIGADFYSSCARSYILSDANVDSLAVDITLDLPQILGRQRLEDNPWKNRAELYYKTLKVDERMTKEEFDEIIQKKLKKTLNLLKSYENTDIEGKHDLAEEYQKLAKDYNYQDQYVAVNEHSSKDLVPCLNKLVMIAEQRAFDVQQIDYKDRFSVFSSINRENYSPDKTSHIRDFFKYFEDLPDFYSKMRAVCECPLTEEERMVILDQIPIQFKQFYTILGPETCKSLSYHSTKLNKKLSDLYMKDMKSKNNEDDNNNLVEDKIYSIFSIGSRYSKIDIKNKLKELYELIGYNKVAKGSDIDEYFETKRCMIPNKETGKSDNGVEILRKKE